VLRTMHRCDVRPINLPWLVAREVLRAVEDAHFLIWASKSHPGAPLSRRQGPERNWAFFFWGGGGLRGQQARWLDKERDWSGRI
jgi:hypothetical protein